jgi:GT2 family glycosyltransferase
MTTLQRLTLPSLDLCSDTELYLRTTGPAWYSMSDRLIRLRQDGIVELDTYFNAFSVGKWRRHTAVRHVALCFTGAGEFEVEAVHRHTHRAERVVAATSVSGEGEFRLDVPSLDELDEGQLYLRIRCVGAKGGVIDGGSVVTDDPVVREARLGVVVTTFNRQEYVAGNVGRLLAALERHPEYRDRLDVLVVDNGRNLTLDLPAGAPVTVLPNPNLGGAGGFARGLIHHREAGRVSHVLFMDDDLRFDPESVFRTVELFSYATEPDLCLAGAMLREEHPYLQFEAGGAWEASEVHPFRAMGQNLDLREPEQLIENEADYPIHYAAWWYFGFPIDLTTDNPIPVFVRGDDILFGLKHGRNTIALNGIGVWHQDFDYKNGPASFYYEHRNLPLVNLLTHDDYSSWHLAKRFTSWGLRSLLAMKYDSADRIILGMEDFLAGPDHWMQIDHEQRNAEVRAGVGERIAPLERDVAHLPDFNPPKHKRLVLKVATLATLGGHLVPERLSRQPLVGISLQDRSAIVGVGREQVLYRYVPTGEGFVATRDRKRFFRLLRSLLGTAARIPSSFDELKHQYRDAYPAMTSDAYWRRQFDGAGHLDSDAADPPTRS